MKKIIKILSVLLAILTASSFVSCAYSATSGTNGNVNNSTSDYFADDSTPDRVEPYTESIDFDFDKIACCNVNAVKTTEAEFVHGENDDWSIHYTPSGTWTFIKVEDSAEIDWSNVKIFSFWVYNPNDNYDVCFGVSLSKNMNLDFSASSTALGKATERAEYGWTKIEIAGSIIRNAVAEGYIYLSISLNYTVNGETSTSEQWKNTHFYIDQFEVVREG